LEDADLYGVGLSKTDLGKANLKAADLGGVALDGVDLSGAIQDEANLNVTNVDPEQLTQATSLKGAILPDETIHE
jgi:uncharacterized protein YjbI with pentapeptide repeats